MSHIAFQSDPFEEAKTVVKTLLIYVLKRYKNVISCAMFIVNFLFLNGDVPQHPFDGFCFEGLIMAPIGPAPVIGYFMGVSSLKYFAQVVSFDSGSHWIFHSTLFLSREFSTAYGYSTPF